jgi:hypothetical protein
MTCTQQAVRVNVMVNSNEEPAWKLTQKVTLTHNSVKNNECDVTYVLKCHNVVPNASFTRHDISHCSVDVAVITKCISATCRISSAGSSLDYITNEYNALSDLQHMADNEQSNPCPKPRVLVGTFFGSPSVHAVNQSQTQGVTVTLLGLVWRSLLPSTPRNRQP